MRDLNGKRITVMGLGSFGGGAGVTRWLVSQGATCLVTDMKSHEDLKDSVEEIRDLIDRGRVSLRLGSHDFSDFTECDAVVANPAVPKPWDNVYLNAAKQRGVTILTEIGLLLERLPDRTRTIAITGSAGKSTTTSLVHHALKRCGKSVALGGNIGGSLLNDIGGAITRETFVVLELSSAMLHWNPTWSPHVAAVTNISENHIDWHGEFDHYRASKQNLLNSQLAGDVAVLGSGVSDWPVREGVRKIIVASSAEVRGLALPGSHNAWNAAVALNVVQAACPDLRADEIVDAMRSFGGLPHRLEFVCERAGVKCYNDSKSTTPESTLIAVNSFDAAKVHLIAGGYDKKADLSAIGRLSSSLAGLYTVGQTGPKIASAAKSSGGRVEECETVSNAITRIFATAKPGEIMLLSPACASWGQFKNYEERGDLFRQLVLGAPS
jgi:UDP-N-acetylmuramoylalanine--D-glutamate ligase